MKRTSFVGRACGDALRSAVRQVLGHPLDHAAGNVRGRASGRAGGGALGPSVGRARAGAVRRQRPWNAAAATAAFVVAAGLGAPSAAQCQPTWLAGDGIPGIIGGVGAWTVWDDDGAGPHPARLFVGGSISFAHDIPVKNLAAWDGRKWSDVGGGLNGSVLALLVDDMGDGPALYVGGAFTQAGGVAANYVAKWNGAQWTALGGGPDEPAVAAIAIYDDGGGRKLYIGGSFKLVNGKAYYRIASWDGKDWKPLSTGIGPAEATVTSLQTFDDGSGPALYVGGAFGFAGGKPMEDVARWDGASFSPVGMGLSGGMVRKLLLHDDGSGPALYATGTFTGSGGVDLQHIARWDGHGWRGMPSSAGATIKKLEDLVSVDDGSGARLYASGTFAAPNTLPFRRVARWDGAGWSLIGDPLGTPGSSVGPVMHYDSGEGGSLYVSGSLEYVDGVMQIARWNGMKWTQLTPGMDAPVRAMHVFDAADGPTLCMGGDFTSAGATPARRVVLRRDGKWSPAGSGMESTVLAFDTFDDGEGTRLLAGGKFVISRDALARGVAAWDGAAWKALGTAPGKPGGGIPEVRAFTVYDDGTGPALFVGGSIGFKGSLAPAKLSKWDGADWTHVLTDTESKVYALGVFDAGAGPELCVAGALSLGPGDHVLTPLACWNGRTWRKAITEPMVGAIATMAVFDDGGGEALFIGGGFTKVDGVTARGIARWDGVEWSEPGGGVGGYTSSSVAALLVHDDGSGPALYAGGSFTTAGGAAANDIARWDGRAWSGLGTGTDGGGVAALATFDDGSGPALFVGGGFRHAGGKLSAYWARWQCLAGDLTGDGCVDAADLGLLIGSFGTCPGEPGYLPAAGTLAPDDPCVEQADLGAMMRNFGVGCPP